MGLPVWREPDKDDSQLKTDPTAHDRSAIRRQRRQRTTIRSPARLHREDTTGNQGGQPDPPVGQPSIQDANVSAQPGGGDGWGYERRNGRTRPRSRRGPTSGEGNLMPPLRRMGRRRVADELTRRQEPEPPLFGTTLPDPTTMGRVNGLGDRQRSWSPADDADAWNVLGSTITPDPSLPSASNSFAADVGTSFASSTRENTRNRPSRVERPAIPRGGAVPDPPEASRPRNQYAWDLRENRRAARAMQGRGVRDNHDIETTSARSESPARRTNGGVHEDQHGPTPFIRRQAESPMFGYEAAPRGSAVTDTELSALRDHQTQLLLLEQENRRRILRMRQELRENGQAEPETGGLRQTEITDYCPHEATREGEADDDGSSTTTSTDSMDEYDEADIVDFVASTSRAEPEAANQINMDLVRECDGFLEALRRLISNNNRSTEDVRNIREGLRQLRRLVDLAADRTSRLGDLAALARENGEAAA